MRILSRQVTRAIVSEGPGLGASARFKKLATGGAFRSAAIGNESWTTVPCTSSEPLRMRRSRSAFARFRGADMLEISIEEQGELLLKAWIPRLEVHATLAATPLLGALWAVPVVDRFVDTLVVALVPVLAVVIEWATGREQRRGAVVLDRMEAALRDITEDRGATQPSPPLQPEASGQPLDGVVRCAISPSEALSALATRVQAGTIPLAEPAGAVMRADPRPTSLEVEQQTADSLVLVLAEPDEALDWVAVKWRIVGRNFLGYRFQPRKMASRAQSVLGTGLGFATMFVLGSWLLAFLAGQEWNHEMPELLRSILCFSWPPSYLAWIRTSSRAAGDAMAIIGTATDGVGMDDSCVPPGEPRGEKPHQDKPAAAAEQ